MATRLKIAYVANSDFNIHNFRLSWLKYLVKEGHEVYAIAPNGRYTKKFNGHGINGFLVPVKNSNILARQMEELILNKSLRQKMGKVSRKKVIEEFSDDGVIKKILGIYRELAIKNVN